MIADNPLRDSEVWRADDSTFPPFTRAHVSPDAASAENDLDGSPFLYESGYICRVDLADELAEKLRKAGEETEVQHRDNVPLTPKEEPKPSAQPESAARPASGPAAQPTLSTANRNPPQTKKNRNDIAHHQQLIDRLNKKPHIIEFKGVILNRNERLKIIAAVALCESGHDPFISENLDSEFHMVPGSNLSYGHIVHIGLSFGIIQFTQDSGGLGKLLQRMQGKDRNKFSKIFGDNCDELVKLTTVGIEVPNVDYQSGQAHWNSIRHTSRGAHLTGLAAHNPLPKSSEIRGKRVQPIATTLGGPKQDLWEGVWKQRFKDAGNVDAFQEAELDFAVEGYMNPVLALCKQKNVRSALGIAFITACAVRGANKQVLMMAAKVCGLAVPFTSGSDEKVALEYIAKLDPAHPNSIGGIAVQKDEIVRARVILKDETGFLAEDHYDPDTYSHQFDN